MFADPGRRPAILSPIEDLLRGFSLLLTGAGRVLSRGRLFGLGLVPPLVTSALFITCFMTLAWASPNLAVQLTPFAEGWPAAEAFRALAALALSLTIGLVLVLLFATTTLAVGAPLYDRISEAMEVPAVLLDRTPPRANPLLGLAEAARRVAIVAVFGVVAVPVLMLVALVPGVGNVVAALGAAVIGGWMIALDMIGAAMDRRGITSLAERNALLRRRPWLTLGFGVPTFVLVSIPGVQLLAFPFATAGGTLLVQRLSAEPAVR